MHTKTESPRQSELEKDKELERKEVQVNVPMEPGTEEQMADRHAVAAGEDRDNTTRTE